MKSPPKIPELQVQTRVFMKFDGMHVECPDTSNPDGKWRSAMNQKTTQFVPPSFDKGMTKVEVKRLRDLCSTILTDVYGDHT